MALAPPLKVAVIGAGVAGLAAARALQSDRHQVVVYEKMDRIGGMWVFDPRVESDPLSQDPDREIVHGSLYPSLRTNLPRQLMGFSDYPFRTLRKGDSGRTFPGHDEVLQFLNDFAEDFGLMEVTRFSTEVIRVERVGLKDDAWLVESRTGGSVSEEVFDAVVVCNGHYTKPRIAHFPGIQKWPGKQLHSHNYRGPIPFQDKVVVVIGAKPSGFDISTEISVVAKEVHVSTRGAGDDPNNIFITLETRDNIWRHSEIKSVHENGEVAFQDGSSVFADIILHCTGYEYHVPFLKTDEIVTVDDNRIGPLYKHVFPPKLAPRLSFVGLPFMSLSTPVIELQTKWISSVLSGKRTLPSEKEMSAEVEQLYRNMEDKGIPKRHTHRIGFEVCFEYLDSLATEVGLSQVDEQIKLITKSYINFILENGFLRAREWEPSQPVTSGVEL